MLWPLQCIRNGPCWAMRIRRMTTLLRLVKSAKSWTKDSLDGNVSSCLLCVVVWFITLSVFCQELLHSSVISPATWIFLAATHILLMCNIFAWKKLVRKRTELIMFCWMYSLKGHSQLFYRADLDTSFVSFEKRLPQPKIKCTRRIHLEIRFNLVQCFTRFSILY